MNIGTDIVYIKRFKKLITNKHFMEKIFTDGELKYISESQNNLATISGIYASKEAFLKAIKKGINDYSLKDIEISHDENHAPFIILHNDLLNLNIANISVSISHDKDYAISVVIVNFS